MGIAIDEGEPGRLDLDHDAVAFFEGVAGVGQGEGDSFDFVGIHWLGVLEAVAEFGPHDFASDEHLEVGICGVGWGEDVDEFGDEVAVGAGDLSVDFGIDVSGDGEIFVERIGHEGENV